MHLQCLSGLVSFAPDQSGMPEAFSRPVAGKLTLDKQDTITSEDEKFRQFLEENGYDTSTMGNH